jgi:hypothetical protein
VERRGDRLEPVAPFGSVQAEDHFHRPVVVVNGMEDELVGFLVHVSEPSRVLDAGAHQHPAQRVAVDL